jgi:thiamine pyrophosphokinase
MLVYAASYDEKGGLISEEKDGLLTYYDKNHSILRQESAPDGKQIYLKTTDSNDVATIINSDYNIKAVASPVGDGNNINNVFLSNKLAYTIISSSDGQIVQLKYPQNN